MDLAASQGGLYRFICDIARASNAAVVSIDTCRGGMVDADDADVRIQRVRGCWADGLPGRRGLTAGTATRLLAAFEQPDVVFMHSLYRGHPGEAARFCKRMGIPYAVVTHGMLDPEAMRRWQPLKRSWFRRGGDRLLREANCIVFTTEIERAKAGFAATDRRAAVLLPGVCGPTDADVACRTAARRALGLPPEKRILLYLNRFSAIKRPLETIRAFGEARPAGVSLAMVGFDADLGRDRLRRAAAGYPEADIRIKGPAVGRAKWELLSAVDGYLSFSVKENFGYSFAEAMWAGLPCIVTAGHDLLDARLHGEPMESVGWVVGIDDAAGLKDAIGRFAAAPEATLTDIATANSSWARRHLGASAFADRVASLLRQLVQGPLPAAVAS
jgi:glycosyltransferase involved in cell wall biosynthesis